MSIARGMIGVAQVGSGPTPEQVRLVQGLLDGYFGIEADAASLDPLSASELAAAVGGTDARRVVDLLVVLEFCRHGDGEAQADLAEEYARALGANEPLMLVARDALGTRLRELSACAPGSLGRAYFEFYDRWQLPFPGEDGGGTATLVPHDFSHVLAGYEPDPSSEIALHAMLTSATGFDLHFSGLVASLSLFESGTFDINDITPKVGALDRPGATTELGEAFKRGSACTCDFSGLDHLALVDELLDDVRRDCGITPRG